MSLERGTYGIEYDTYQRGPGNKLWLLALLIPLLLVIVVLRGCVAGDRGNTIYAGDELVETDERDLPEVQVKRERPSLFSHFFRSWRDKGGNKSDSARSGITESESGLSTDQTIAQAGGTERGSQSDALSSDMPEEVSHLIKRADELRDAGKLVSARMMLEKLRLRPDAAKFRALIEKRIGELNIELIFSDTAMPGKVRHTVARGDLISRLSVKYKNTQEYILRVNAIEHPERIRIGSELWVLDNPGFELMIDKSDYKAVLLFNHRFFKVYTVGIGSEKSVPSGSYTVRSRRSSLNERGERLFTLILDSAVDAADAATLMLHAAESYAAVGRTTDAEGILFTPAEAEELHILLPAGSMVTIVD